MKFNYQARTKEGEVQAGTIESSSKEAALNLLQRQGLYITVLEEAAASPFYARRVKIFERTSKKEIVLFSRQLAIMFKAQIPLTESLRTLAKQTKNLDFKEKILKIVEEIEAGVSFSNALARYRKIFSSLYVAMVRSGEVSGRLSDVLDYLAEHEEREYHLVSKIRGALIYPCLIVFVALAVLVMLGWFVIPNLDKIFQLTGQQLPLATRMVMALGKFIQKWGWLVALLLLALVALIFRYYQSKEGKRLFHKLFLGIPLLNEFLKMVYLSRFAENLATLISGGLPIARALEVSGAVIGNLTYQNVISEAREAVRRGVQISAVLSQYPDIFPAMFCQMILVGEKTGTLDSTLSKVVSFYQKEVDRTIGNLLSILEPALVVFLGLIVGGLMAAVLLPLYKAMTI